MCSLAMIEVGFSWLVFDLTMMTTLVNAYPLYGSLASAIENTSSLSIAIISYVNTNLMMGMSSFYVDGQK
jgi:hypothetical protein